MVDRIPRGIRARTTAAAVGLAALALAVAALGLLWVLENNLEGGLDTTVEAQARTRADLLAAGGQPTALAEDSGDGESMVWIGTADGETLAAGGSYRVVDAPPDLSVGGARSADILVEEPQELSGAVEREVTTFRWAVASASDGTLVGVGAETESVAETVGEVRRLLAIGLPILVVVLGIVTWGATGRTLRPVQRIRTTAEGISAETLSDRVPVPETRDEVQRLAETMNHMLDRLERQQIAQRRFTADASHELKSPVANLRATVETSGIDDPGWDRLQPLLVSETERLAAIVEDLLFLSVNDEAPLATLDVDTVHVDDLLFDEAEGLAARSTLSVDIGGVGPCDVSGDTRLIARAIRNLVSNAERHASSIVAMRCSVDGSTATIEIMDDGPGVPLEMRDVVFERFGRTAEARDRASGGTGLGLAIVDGIVTRHGGAVTVGDAPTGGARFCVTLPTDRAL